MKTGTTCVVDVVRAYRSGVEPYVIAEVTADPDEDHSKKIVLVDREQSEDSLSGIRVVRCLGKIDVNHPTAVFWELVDSR